MCMGKGCVSLKTNLNALLRRLDEAKSSKMQKEKNVKTKQIK